VPVSAHTGEGVDDLLEMILLQADMLQLRANPNRMAKGVIIEAKLDKARGPLATVLLQNGTLHVGDAIVAGMSSGRVRALLNDRGERVQEAGPAMPVEISGFDEVPTAGDDMIAVEDEHLARQVVEERREKQKAARIAASKVSLDNLFSRMDAFHYRRYTRSRRMNAILSDVLTGMRVVKAFSKEDEEIERFDKSSTRVAQNNKKLSIFNNYSYPLAGIILYLGNIIALGVGGWMVIKGYRGFTYGQLLTFTAYVNMIYSPMYFFSQMVDWSASSSNALQRLFEILDTKPDITEKEDAIELTTMNGSVEFKDVDFSYTKNRKIIDKVSFNVDAGHVLGIVGHTGAGKSTIANLIIRLYDCDEGEVLIDGVNVKDLSFSSLYNNIAIVSQETYLFIGTILENIKYAKPDATYEEVIQAAKCAGAHDFIMRMPDGYNTKIGFGYKDLSGGERQRVSIARAILRDPKILILDEATAAMDTETEKLIQNALSTLTRGKTTIMIAHRLSTLRDADKLIVIERGRVAEEGTHKELLDKEEGVYRKLFTLQQEALKNAGITE
jgi:ATP-binding cassette subfamily B protein